MTDYTERRIIVLLDDDADTANTAAKQVDIIGGELTFIRTPATGARWCNWAMTPAELVALRQEFAQRGLAQEIEIVPDGSGGFHAEVHASILIFDTVEWEPPEVQAVLAATDPVIAQGIPEGALDGVVL